MAESNNEKSMETTTRISLVRHGQVHNPQGVFYGRLPRFRLSPEGSRQARSAGRFLASQPVSAVFSSPLLRARQTAMEIVAFHPGIDLRLSRLLLEVRSPWDGKPAAEVDARRGDVYSDAGPEYEQPRDIVLRVGRFFKQILRHHPGGHTVAVTHGDVIAFTVLWARRREASARRKAGLHKLGIGDGYPATGSITTFLYDSDSIDDQPAISYIRPA